MQRQLHTHSTYIRPHWQVADIFDRYWESFRNKHKVSVHQARVVWAIRNCRTARLGGHRTKCDNCGYEYHAYNSCRDRHCPKCQFKHRLIWLKERLAELLPVPYYHIVFTIPHILNDLVLYNKRLLYDHFFEATSYALNAFALDPKFLGAQLGFIGILHTWGQALSYHVHIHYIVAGGGFDQSNNRFIRLPYQKKFLFPSKALSKTVRARFIRLLTKSYESGLLVFPGHLSALRSRDCFNQLCKEAGQAAWFNYVKKPFTGSARVLEYLGRYTHRVAISNQRISNVDNDAVSFRYKDYRDANRTKTMALSPDHFIQRFLWHILPSGFRKIRYYGFMGYAVRSKRLQQIRSLLHEFLLKSIESAHHLNDYLERFSDIIDKRCPVCKSGFMISEPILLNHSP